MNCMVCETKSSREFHFKDVDVFRCPCCGHAFSANYRVNVDEIYGLHYFTEAHKNWFNNPDKKLFKYISKSILKFKNKNASIIDLGCGNGNFLNYLALNGFRNLTGLDIVEQNNIENFEYIKGDIEKIEGARKFDVVVTMMNIEHLKDPNRYIQQLKKLGKEDSIFIINTIDESSLIYKIAGFLFKFGFKSSAERLYHPHHINHYSQASLERVCYNNGLNYREKFKKNYPLNSVDIDNESFKYLKFAGIIVINFLSDFFKRQISQTIILERKAT